MPINPLNTGMARRSPPKSFRPSSPPLRLSSSARNQNKAAAVMPWLNSCSITPVSAAAFSLTKPASAPVEPATATMPRMQYPKWLIEE